MTLRIYDTMAREKRFFEPQDPSRITLYVCGPTVYNYAHIGNARPPVVFDVLRRLLKDMYGRDAVVFARNFTDVDDKIIKAHQETGEPIAAITKKYADIYLEDMSALNVLAPDLSPRATDHISDMIAIGEQLKRKGYAYVTKDGLYFQVDQMSDYGKLSGRRQEDNEAGARIAVDEGKRNPADFAIWKFAKEGEPEDAIWDSPWGRGRPGWHIECSAMIKALMGDTIDIHGGGIDLQFPHHENEIAQSECAHGETLANYWMHNGFLDMEGEKMSKSLGNVKLVHDLTKEWPGEVLRYALLSGHYRAPLDWTRSLLEQSKTTLDRIYGAYRRVWGDGHPVADNRHGVRDKLMDDLNTPLALADLSYGAYDVRLSREGFEAQERRLVISEDEPIAAIRGDLSRVAETRTASLGVGSLFVDTRPRGVEVWLDRRLVGDTPMLIPDVSAGAHEVEFRYDGYRDWATTVQVGSSVQARVTASLDHVP